MRYSVQLPTHRVDTPEEFLTASALSEMARCAESAGFDACFVTEHPFPSDKWLAGGGHHALDPFVALSFAAAATQRIRLQTHILVAAYRNPFLTAKAAASLDRVSGGRLILGLGAGYLKGEFAALGADFERRNESMDETIAALRAAWTRSGVHFEGLGYRALGNSMLPRPAQRGGPPIWVGGNSRRAIRRAVESAEGWVPFPNPSAVAAHQRTAALDTPDDLRERIDYARAHAQRVGRSAPLEICCAPFGATLLAQQAYDADRLRAESEALARLGVTWLALTLPDAPRERWCEQVLALQPLLAH